MVDQRLTILHQLFSWTSVEPSKCSIMKMMGSQDPRTVWGVPWAPWEQANNSITESLFHMNNFWKLGIVKKFIFFHVSFASVLWLLLDERLPAFHQLFSWTLVGSSKCLINKLTGSQGYLIVWAVLRLRCVLAENSFTESFLQMNKFLN